ncbi:RNA polymerase, sigma-24 subunit, ECF subfamily [Cystobacter fuscus]|uniref:RNA polymerase, sigma-24 subunit, ECF subfamily n=1 Tax=Cystobacter fuscus TaxID=43 RepID=A0A250J3J6_9BACT|nr:sigma-70 family RNA polymerase sigma factor [Cystobacter fuscus]ATB38082.1 RNA polymerase, sigma-24 subunit, ECF subfamily [Cystobacter fuscus]
MAMDREQLEQDIRELCRSADTGRAVERALQGYGMEIMRLIASVMHNPEQANDAFSLFCENLLKGLPGFRWESSFRTWAYRLARNACYQLLHAPAARETPVTASLIPEQPEPGRSDTQPWQRTSVKERFRALRDSLQPEERMILMFRVDQRLSWTEVARVMWDEDEPPTSAALNRKATSLRQQFQRIKAHLRTMAIGQGLIEQDNLGG